MRLNLTLATLALLVGASGAFAANPHEVAKDRAEATRDMQKDQAHQDYRNAKAGCRSLSGDAEDICLKDARATYKSALAEAKADEKSAKAYAEANEESYDAKYKAAKERCKVLSGKAQDTCIGEAKMKYYQ